jgi:hypothetical protein
LCLVNMMSMPNGDIFPNDTNRLIHKSAVWLCPARSHKSHPISPDGYQWRPLLRGFVPVTTKIFMRLLNQGLCRCRFLAERNPMFSNKINRCPVRRRRDRQGGRSCPAVDLSRPLHRHRLNDIPRSTRSSMPWMLSHGLVPVRRCRTSPPTASACALRRLHGKALQPVGAAC